MHIWFYAPFKPLDHPNPSGDRIIGQGLVDFLGQRGHRLRVASRLRARWLYWRPWLWPRVVRDRRRIHRCAQGAPPQLWLTYHSYYKAPDVLGPAAAARWGCPYVVFQGIYSTKRRRSWRTRPGFWLNRRALLAAAHVFTNRRADWVNLTRLVPPGRVDYVPPGIFPDQFAFDPQARRELRQYWGVDSRTVALTAAMFRPGVKTVGLEWVIRTCAHLVRQRGLDLTLVVAGTGREAPRLQRLAGEVLPGRVRFLGRVARRQLHRCYSAADLFVFPGLRESLGMVYLEAQSCGLPVVAFDNGGVPEVVRHGHTGWLTPVLEPAPFAAAVGHLVQEPHARRRMGAAARRYVRTAHDVNVNYARVDRRLRQLAADGRGRA